MSINLSVGANGATTGRTDHSIAGDGELDTRAEAEAALAFLPEGSTDTVMVGEREYTRAQLIELRDRETPAPAPERPAAPSATRIVPGEGVSHGISADGFGSGGLSSYAHSGGGARLLYTAEIPVVTGDTRVGVDLSVGGDFASLTMNYSTPGGEPASSSYSRYGARIAAGVRLVPPVLDHRLWASFSASLGIGGFSTPDSTRVSTPGMCMPGDFGRPDCEPMAGPLTGNAGTTGLRSGHTGSSRGTSGLGLSEDLILTVGADILQETWGTLALYGYAGLQFTQLFPSDGNGISDTNFIGGGGAMVRFGGSAETHVVSDEAAPAEPITESASVAQGESYSLGAPEGGWREGDEVWVNETRMTDPTVPTSGNDAYTIPGDALNAEGTNTIEIRRGGQVLRRVELRVNPSVSTDTDGNASANGFALSQVLHVTRPPLVPGQAEAPLNIGSIVSEASVPRGMRVEVRIDNERVGDPIELVRDGRTALTIPATVANGTHSVEFRIVDATGNVRHRFVGQPIMIGPGTATLSAASVPPPSRGTTFVNDPIRVLVTSDVPTRARIFVGTHFEDVNLVAGANTITLSGAPRTWTDTGAPTRRATLNVRVQPLDAAGALTGTEVNAGSVTVIRSGGAPAHRGPRLPGAGAR